MLQRFYTFIVIQELVTNVAVVTSSRHADRSCARRSVVAKPRFCGRRSFCDGSKPGLPEPANPLTSTVRMYCSAYSEPMTSHALGGLADSQRKLMQQREAGGRLDSMASIRNPTTSIDAHLLYEQSCQISSRSYMNRRNLRLFGERRPNKKKNKNKMSSCTGSVLIQKPAATVFEVVSQTLRIVNKAFQNTPKRTSKVQQFSGRGHSPLPRSYPRWRLERGCLPPQILPPSRLRPLTLDPLALKT